MSSALKCRASRSSQSGHATVEYAIIAGVLAATLFAAVPPAGQAVTQAIHDFYASLTFFVSLP